MTPCFFGVTYWGAKGFGELGELLITLGELGSKHILLGTKGALLKSEIINIRLLFYLIL